MKLFISSDHQTKYSLNKMRLSFGRSEIFIFAKETAQFGISIRFCPSNVELYRPDFLSCLSSGKSKGLVP